MFGKKIEYIRNQSGKIVGVNVGRNKFRIEEYSLMMNKPSYYLYDHLGTKDILTHQLRKYHAHHM